MIVNAIDFCGIVYGSHDGSTRHRRDRPRITCNLYIVWYGSGDASWIFRIYIVANLVSSLLLAKAFVRFSGATVFW